METYRNGDRFENSNIGRVLVIIETEVTMMANHPHIVFTLVTEKTGKRNMYSLDTLHTYVRDGLLKRIPE